MRRELEHVTDSAVYEIERRTNPTRPLSWERAAALEPRGWCDCADVAVTVPAAWAGTILWRIWLRQGATLTLEAQGTIAGAGLAPLGGQLTGPLHRLRGVHFDELAVELQLAAGVASPGTGTCRLAGWARSDYPWGELVEGGALQVGGTVTTTPLLALADRPQASVDTRVVSASACVAVGQHAHNPNAADVWLLVWPLAAVPAAGTAPGFMPLRVPAGGVVSREWPSVPCAAGLCWAASSTAATYTAAPLTPLWVDTFYRGP